jgi:hypothetical protein
LARCTSLGGVLCLHPATRAWSVPPLGEDPARVAFGIHEARNQFGAIKRVRHGKIYPFDVYAISDTPRNQQHITDKLDSAYRG